MSDPTLLRNLELAIQFGKWFLIENVGEELDPALEPILLKQVDKSGTLRLGDKSIPWNNDFKFFLTTTIPNPHYAPETQVKVSILNFAITPFGLEEQMLNLFIAKEMPDLQKKKEEIITRNAQAAKTTRDIENRILKGLTKNSEIVKILEDDELIDVLAEAKITGDEIALRMKESKVAEEEIDRTRATFRPVAFRAQILFFTIVDLAVIDPMYQYSLQWFSNLFAVSVDTSQKSNDPDARIEILNNHFTQSLYDNVCRSLFEKDKTLFSLKLTVNIMFGDNRMDADELRFFLAGPSGEVTILPNPTDWLGDLEWGETYRQLHVMTKILPCFEGFEQFFVDNNAEFRKIFDDDAPQEMPIPGEWNSKLTSFQKMIVLKTFRPDKIVLAVQNFIIEQIGKQFIEPPTFNLAKSYKDSSITTPLIFVLSAGSDPVADFERFAGDMNMTKKVEKISLGRGQGPKAHSMINDNLTRGGWVLLMNCHLAVSWMPTLEAICEQIDDTKHRDFRLWLTSMPTPAFPVSVLQNSVKMTLEPPSGLRANVLGSYEALTEEQFGGCTKPETYKMLLFGFCFFHAIVQDRRKFGPIGWNIPYAFTNEDLMVCRRQLKNFVEDYEEVPFKVLNIVGAYVNYGGRVTDDKDVRLITTILETYMCPEMLNVGHKLSESGIYYCINPGEKEEYIDYIKSLPLNPKPEAFGLHNNAEITTSQIATQQLLESMIAMQPKTSSGKGKTREEIIGDQCKYLYTNAPKPFDLDMIQKKYPTMYTESMNTVLLQECVRYNALLKDMQVQLPLIQRALLGEVTMSESLENMATSIFDNMVPKYWAAIGFLSMKPLASWIEDLNERISFLNNWYEKGTPIVFWISGFFFPQAFLTSTMQNYARSKEIAIDRLSFQFIMKDEIKWQDVTAKPDAGVFCYGMYIEGCRWNYQTHQLDDSEAKKLFVEMPMLHLLPTVDRVTPETGIYYCPVYKVLSRTGTLSTTGHSTNYVIMMEMNSGDVPQRKWIKAGVAAFLALKY
jgi:dynein heavy chain, axonemal